MKNTQFIRNFFKLRVCIRLRGFSLPEVTIALLLVSLGASALISNVGSGRLQEVNNARFSAAFRLAAELSDWARLGGLNALAPGPQNPFDLLEDAGLVPACFSSPCDARLGAFLSAKLATPTASQGTKRAHHDLPGQRVNKSGVIQMGL